MKMAKLDVPVLMVFFIRPDMFKKVFEQVKLARPKQLFLFQDGARKGNPTDEANRMKCREVLNGIDWECDVHTFYPETNYGVDACVYGGIKWAFEHVDQLIILEDDIVASQSFFKFADEMLEKYKDNDDIAMVGGMNHFKTYKANKSSYIFAQSCAIWGWATWKRFFDEWDQSFSFLNDEETRIRLKQKMGRIKFNTSYKKAVKVMQTIKQTPTKASFEASSAFASFIGNKKAIVPTKNLITNIGIGADGFHTANNIKKLNKIVRNLFFMERYNLSFPLVAPKTTEQDKRFNRKVDWIIYPPYFVGLIRKIESKIRRLFIK